MAKKKDKTEYLPYETVKRLVNSKRFRSKSQFWRWFKTDERKSIYGFPYYFEQVYIDEFNWDDFLGPDYAEDKAQTYNRSDWTYEEVQTFAISKGIKTQKEWKEYWIRNKDSRPYKFPLRPDIVFTNRGEWKGWRHLLGTTLKSEKIDIEANSKLIDDKIASLSNKTAKILNLPFAQFRMNVRRLNLTTMEQYKHWCKANAMQDKGYPLNPDKVYSYKKQWTDWPDVLGTYDPSSPSFTEKCTYIEAKRYAHSLNLKTDKEWRQYWIENPTVRPDIPRYPETTYGSYWEGWKKFLGVGLINQLDEELYTGGVLYVAHTTTNVSNVFEIGVEMEGLNALYSTVILEKQFKLIAVFKYQDQTINNILHRNTADYVKHIIRKHSCGTHYKYEGVIINNIWELITDLKDVFEQIKFQIPKHVAVASQTTTTNWFSEPNKQEEDDESKWNNVCIL